MVVNDVCYVVRCPDQKAVAVDSLVERWVVDAPGRVDVLYVARAGASVGAWTMGADPTSPASLIRQLRVRVELL